MYGKVVKVGVIGCGIGFHHINGYKSVSDVEVVALADLDEKKGRKIASDLCIPNFYTDYKEMLKNEEMDAVSVCVPNFLHSKIAIEVLKSGRHVLAEKPMAMNVKEAKEMQDIAKKMKKILMIGFTHRFRADSQTLMKLINDGILGNIYHARAYALRRRGIQDWVDGLLQKKNLEAVGL